MALADVDLSAVVRKHQFDFGRAATALSAQLGKSVTADEVRVAFASQQGIAAPASAGTQARGQAPLALGRGSPFDGCG